MLNFKNGENKRYLSIIIMLVIIIPCFLITLYANKVGRCIGSILYMCVTALTIWEVLKILNFNKYVSLITSFSSVLFFLLPFDQYTFIINNNYSNISFRGVIMNSFSWKSFLLIGIFSFIPMIIETIYSKNKRNIASIQLIIIFIIFMACTFFKGLWIFNCMSIKPIFFFLMIAIFSDSFAYFGGKLFGAKLFHGAKLAPKISPNKTWAGTVIGFIASSIFAIISGYYLDIWNGFSINKWILSSIMGVFLSIMSPIGDLIFSLIKRKIGVKDFSNLLPGHGGIFDRIDSMSFVVVVSIIIYSIDFL